MFFTLFLLFLFFVLIFSSSILIYMVFLGMTSFFIVLNLYFYMNISVVFLLVVPLVYLGALMILMGYVCAILPNSFNNNFYFNSSFFILFSFLCLFFLDSKSLSYFSSIMVVLGGLLFSFIVFINISMVYMFFILVVPLVYLGALIILMVHSLFSLYRVSMA